MILFSRYILHAFLIEDAYIRPVEVQLEALHNKGLWFENLGISFVC